MYRCATNDQKLKENPAFRSITTCVAVSLTTRSYREHSLQKASLHVLIKNGIKPDHLFTRWKLNVSMSPKARPCALPFCLSVTARTRACLWRKSIKYVTSLTFFCSSLINSSPKNGCTLITTYSKQKQQTTTTQQPKTSTSFWINTDQMKLGASNNSFGLLDFHILLTCPAGQKRIFSFWEPDPDKVQFSLFQFKVFIYRYVYVCVCVYIYI